MCCKPGVCCHANDNDRIRPRRSRQISRLTMALDTKQTGNGALWKCSYGKLLLQCTTWSTWMVYARWSKRSNSRHLGYVAEREGAQSRFQLSGARNVVQGDLISTSCKPGQTKQGKDSRYFSASGGDACNRLVISVECRVRFEKTHIGTNANRKTEAVFPKWSKTHNSPL